MEGNKKRGRARILEGLYYRSSDFLECGQRSAGYSQTDWHKDYRIWRVGSPLLRSMDTEVVETELIGLAMLVGERELKVTSLIRINDPTWNLEDIHSWTLTLEWE